MEAMNTRLPTVLILVAALAPAAWSQSPDTPTPAAEPPPAAASAAATTPAAGNGAALPSLFAAHSDTPAAAAPAANRTVSPELANVLASGMPKYAPPKPADSTADATADAIEAPDQRDIDKPRNEIKRLPKYMVQAPKPPVFRERDLYTPGGQTALSYLRNPGLSLFPFSGLNAPIADQMYQDQERLNNISDLTDTARSMARGGDSAEGMYIMREAQDTYMRDSIFGWNGSSMGGK
jgi:hypothetical protein